MKVLSNKNIKGHKRNKEEDSIHITFDRKRVIDIQNKLI